MSLMKNGRNNGEGDIMVSNPSEKDCQSNIGRYEHGLVTVSTTRYNELIEIEKRWNFLKDSLKGEQNDNK